MQINGLASLATNLPSMLCQSEMGKIGIDMIVL